MLLSCFDNDLKNNIENTAWSLEHNAEKLQEILNGIKQGIIYTHKGCSEGAENKERNEQEKSESTENFKNVCVMFQKIIRILNPIKMNVG